MQVRLRMDGVGGNLFYRRSTWCIELNINVMQAFAKSNRDVKLTYSRLEKFSLKTLITIE